MIITAEITEAPSWSWVRLCFVLHFLFLQLNLRSHIFISPYINVVFLLVFKVASTNRLDPRAIARVPVRHHPE